MPSPRFAVLVLALAGALSAGAAFAADGGSELPEACRSDVASLCPGIAPGDRKLRKCMKQHHDQVSAGCRKAFKQARAAHEAKPPVESQPATGGGPVSGKGEGSEGGGEGPDGD